ncbi:MAG: hypothetical protein WD623_10675 [Marinobacter sp.]|uniref:hypothetical protein n=1 Tax=Marinobacter sp. TaxID=50741 RepID=UPI0034A046E8
MKTLVIAGLIALLMSTAAPGYAVEAGREDWKSIVRDSPYWVSQGVYDNITTIRRWVLTESGYCSDQDRHIFYDIRGRFISYLDDGDTREATQAGLNRTRQSLAKRGQVDVWAKGEQGQTGYPFALACRQPHVDLNNAVARYLGTIPSALIWGTWDDLVVGNADEPKSLHDSFAQVYNKRLEQERLNLPPELHRYLAGQLLIESGGQQRAHSTAGAKGILQLSPAALSDCGIAPRSHWHRLAQIDCALKLMSQNARNLRPAFEERFGHLPEKKRDRLFTLLLIQAYHGGVGRVNTLLTDDELARPAEYFAENQARYTSGDIAFGMIFHNLGRNRLGLASLYYVADVQLATEALCNSSQLRASDFCQ